MALKAVTFDLDGVLTDTAEYHYQSWKRLTEEAGLPFNRDANEQLRGVSRAESLRRILNGRSIPQKEFQEMLDRKNNYYREMLDEISTANLLPGVPELLAQLDEAGIPYAVASSSRNARDVVTRLGLADRLAVIADGSTVQRQKPAPDLFRYVAAHLQLPPSQCLVIEDAAAGIQAALVAGMPALALGPIERFQNDFLPTQIGFTHRESLAGIQLAELQAASEIDPGWTISQNRFDPAGQHHMETIFTLGNGYFASRGSLEERYPGDQQLTLAHGIFDDVPLGVTELANLPDWLDLRISVDGQAFRLDKGQLLHFQRHLHLRHGILRRELRWQAPNGLVLDITFERFASYTQPQVGALRVLITAVNDAGDVTVEVGINGHVANDNLLHWDLLAQGQADDDTIWLRAQTRASRIMLGTVATVSAPAATGVACQDCPGQPTLTLSHKLVAGQTFQVDKLVAYASDRDPVADTADVVDRARAALAGVTYDSLQHDHIRAWQSVWEDIDVLIEGDDEAQQAVRFNLFQLQVAAPRHDDRVSIGAKTLSGLGYRGHVFWDTEIFILPFFIYTQPEVARNLLLYRYHTLAGARRKAAANGYPGAQYAWESADTGDEVTPTWLPGPSGKELVRIWTGDIELHISADIAYAIMQYWRVTGDDSFMRDYGAEIILDTARFWGARAELEEENGRRRYAIRDVIGPDEYHDHVDNNAFTNRMVQWHLETALNQLDWLRAEAPERAAALIDRLGLDEPVLSHWQDVIDHIIIPVDPETGLITQFDGFFDLKPVDWPRFKERTESMQSLLGIDGANAHQVIKQADVIMLLCLLRDEVDAQTWQINWDTYMPLTDHRYGSSLGPSFHAWAASEMNRPDEAYDHFRLAARADLYDVRGNAGDGIHGASAGGLWQAVVFGFAGLRLTETGYSCSARLPSHWQRLAFSFYLNGRRQQVDIHAPGKPAPSATQR